ncbi:MAG: PAS domain S-box protein [Sideroxyarcus sp.]|nr:PAS domain S-box protein [Sideroxyarcus sp.]
MSKRTQRDVLNGNARFADVLHRVLAAAHVPETAGRALAEEVLRLTAVRLVVLVQTNAGDLLPVVAPASLRSLAAHPSIAALLREAGELESSRFYASDTPVPGLEAILSAENRTNCLAVPLIDGSVRVGTIAIFGLAQGEALDAATGNMEMLAPLLAMVIHNAVLAQRRNDGGQETPTPHESELRLREMVRRLPIPVALYDAQGTVLLVNDRVTATFGYTRENVPHLSDFWPQAFPDPESRAQAQARWAAALAEAQRTGSTDTRPEEFLITCKDGTVRLTEVFGTFVGDSLLVVLSDVSDRRQTEAELEDYRTQLENLVDERTREVRIRQERLVVALESTNTGLWEWDPTTRGMYFSPTYFTMLGWEPDEFPANQETWTSMVHPDDFPDTYAFFRGIAMSAEDISFSHEYRLRSKPGPWRWFLVRGKIVGRNERGQVNRVVGVYIDITERKEEEKNLQMAMQALDTTRECVYWIDEDGRILYVNPATERELGYTSAELLQMSIPDIDPNTPKELWGPEGELTRRLNDEGLRKFVTQHRHRDGHLITVEVDSDAFHFGGQTCFIAITRDISERLAAEDALRKSEAKFRSITDAANDGIIIIDDAGRITFWNAAAETIFGYAREEILGREIHALLPPQRFREAADRGFEHFRTTGEGPIINKTMTLEALRKGGEEFFIELSLSAVRLGDTWNAVGIARDISERLAAQEALRSSEAKFTAIFSLTPEPMALTRLSDGVVLEVNRSYADFFGYQPNEIIGHSTLPGDLNLWVDAEQRRQWMERLKRDGELLGYETQLRRRDGSTGTLVLSAKIVEFDNEPCVIVDIHDITEQKQQAERLLQIAHHDPLTGLPNRLLLGDRLRQAIARNRRGEALVAVCYLDLDGFKAVNDRYGHEAGDNLLTEVAGRLTACVRGGDTVARLGGDEFVVLLSGLADEEECRTALDRVLQTVSAPYAVGDSEQSTVSASIGVTLYPNDEVDPDTLMRHADHAMYAAKQAGKNRFQMFDTRLEQRIEARLATLELLAEAQKSKQFLLYYQPKVDCRLGRVVGAEALIRWQHPTLGLLSPAEFLPLIEDTELALSVGEWVVREAFFQMAQWRRDGIDLRVSVNAFVRHLLHPGFADTLVAIMNEYPGMGRNCLMVEIVETAARKELDSIRRVMEDCMGLGIAFSLDDFGTGYSTLAHLRHLPAAEIKIDHSFVRHMLERPEDIAIVEAVIGMGRAFGRSIVAEGAETPDHIVRLLEMGCDVMQGYALARPMAAADIPRWLREFRPDPLWYRPEGNNGRA